MEVSVSYKSKSTVEVCILMQVKIRREKTSFFTPGAQSLFGIYRRHKGTLWLTMGQSKKSVFSCQCQWHTEGLS